MQEVTHQPWTTTEEYYQAIIVAAAFVKSTLGTADIALVLGSGLGNFVTELTDSKEVAYSEIPGAPQTSVVGHAGKLIRGKLRGGRWVLCMAGRSHGYEGKYMFELNFMARMLAYCGVKVFIATNASGGSMPGMLPGSLMIIKDHINFYKRNPLLDSYQHPGICRDKHPSMSHIYSKRLRELAHKVAAKVGIAKIFEGVYGGTSGPTYETPTEVQAYIKMGAGCFGMSTIPETMAVSSLGLEVFGMALVTNMAAGLVNETLTHGAVTEVANQAAKHFVEFMSEFVASIEIDPSTPDNSLYVQQPLPNPLPLITKTFKPASRKEIEASIKSVKDSLKGNPTVAVVVSNSDSTKFIATLNVISRLSYRSIPNFPILRCRDAEFVLGKLENGNELLVLNGHCSSGMECEEARFLGDLLVGLGIRKLVHAFQVGSSKQQVHLDQVVLITDAIEVSSVYPVSNSVSFPQFSNTNLFSIQEWNGKKGWYISYGGPSHPTDAELYLAERSSCELFGFTSLALISSCRSVGIETMGLAHVVYDSSSKAIHSDSLVNQFKFLFADHTFFNPTNSTIPTFNEPIHSTQQAYFLSRPISVGSFDMTRESIEFLKSRFPSSFKPSLSVFIDSLIDYSRLNIQKELKVLYEIDAKEIPHVEVSGKVKAVEISGKQVLIFVGSEFMNSGMAAPIVTYPIRMLKGFTNRILFVGGVCSTDESKNPIGSGVVISDHVMWSGRNPLFGPNEIRWGERFSDMGDCYTKSLRNLLSESKEFGKVNKAMLAHVSGPTFSSEPERKLLNEVGLDVVSVGLVPEIIIARHMSCEIASIALVISSYKQPISPLSDGVYDSFGTLLRHSIRELVDFVIPPSPTGAAPELNPTSSSHEVSSTTKSTITLNQVNEFETQAKSTKSKIESVVSKIDNLEKQLRERNPSKSGISNGWYSEIKPELWPGQAMSLEVEEILFEGKSDFQDILVFKSKSYGNVLVLDNAIQASERDEFAYQEMLTHIPMNSHPNPERVCLIGGGDGGVLREIAKHSQVKEMVICEIDKMVMEVSKKYLPSMAKGLEDKRLEIVVGDGAAFLKSNLNRFDVIIVDSSDPIGPAETLYAEDFYSIARKSLREGGILATQAECQWLHLDLIKKIMKNASKSFSHVEYAYTTIPTYPSGQIGFLIANSSNSSCKQPKRNNDSQIQARYYNSEIHSASFVLPNFVVHSLSEQ